MTRKFLMVAALALFVVIAFNAPGHAFALGPTTPPVTSTAVAPPPVGATLNAVSAQVEDGAPDGAAVKSTAPDTDAIQSGAQGGQQIEDGLPDTGAPEAGG